MLRTLTAASMVLISGFAMAQSVGNAGNPAAADTTDPNSAPLMRSERTAPRGAVEFDTAGRANTADPNSAPLVPPGPATTGKRTLDPVGRANTSDLNSAFSGATNSAGQPVNPVANPRVR